MNFLKKKALLSTILSITICIFFAQNLILSASEDGKNQNGFLKIGDSVPVMEMEDIDGNEICNKDFSERIIVYSFADRNSNKPLQAAIGPAAKKVVKAYPNLKIAYINFADVVIVPSLLKHVVNPILRYINDSNSEEMKKQYEEEGLPWNEKITKFILVPEWEGDHMEAFGMEDAKNWVTFIVYKDKVHAVLDSRTKDYAGDFFKTFKKLAPLAK